MEIKEISIGNLFRHKPEWSYRQGDKLSSFQFAWDERDWYALGECTLNLSAIEPITPSIEVLKEIGFTVFPMGKEGEFSIAKKYRNNEIERTVHFAVLKGGKILVRGFNDFLELDYIHQFQNYWNAVNTLGE